VNHGCSVRFFTVQVMKLMMPWLLHNYEVKLDGKEEEEGKRLKDF